MRVLKTTVFRHGKKMNKLSDYEIKVILKALLDALGCTVFLPKDKQDLHLKTQALKEAREILYRKYLEDNYE